MISSTPWVIRTPRGNKPAEFFLFSRYSRHVAAWSLEFSFAALESSSVSWGRLRVTIKRMEVDWLHLLSFPRYHGILDTDVNPFVRNKGCN